jgi:hypothetical protein
MNEERQLLHDLMRARAEFIQYKLCTTQRDFRLVLAQQIITMSQIASAYCDQRKYAADRGFGCET